MGVSLVGSNCYDGQDRDAAKFANSLDPTLPSSWIKFTRQYDSDSHWKERFRTRHNVHSLSPDCG